MPLREANTSEDTRAQLLQEIKPQKRTTSARTQVTRSQKEDLEADRNGPQNEPKKRRLTGLGCWQAPIGIGAQKQRGP